MMMFMMMMMMNIKPANATETGFDEKAHFELFSTTVWQSTTVDHIVPAFSGDYEEGYSKDDEKTMMILPIMLYKCSVMTTMMTIDH